MVDNLQNAVVACAARFLKAVPTTNVIRDGSRLNQVFTLVLKSKVLPVLYVSLPKVLGGACAVGTNVALLHYFGPAQFGLFFICMSWVLLVDSVLGSSFDMGVLRLAPLYRVSDPTRSYSVQKVALALKLALAVTISLFVAAFAKPLADNFFNDPDRHPLIYLSCAASLVMLLLRSSQTQLQVEERFTAYGLLDLAHTALRYGGVALLIGLSTVSPEKVIGLFAFAPLLVFCAWSVTFGRAVFSKGQFDGATASEILGHVKWILLTFSLTALTSRLDIILLTARSTIEEVGILSAGLTFVMIPQLLGTYLAVVLGPRVMPRCEDGSFYQFFRTFQLTSFACCIALLLLAVPLIRVIMPWALPDSFAKTEQVVLILLPGALAGLATFPLTITFLMFKRPRFLFVMDCLALPLMLVSYNYAAQLYGALGAAGVTSLTWLTKASIAQVAAWREASRLAINSRVEA